MLIQENEKYKLLSSLRNGVASNNLLDYMITGRDGLVSELKTILNHTSRGIDNFKFITGEYGSGKTFLIQYFAKLAIEDNFVVSKLTVGKSFRFNKLDDLYYNIMHNLFIHNENSEKATSFDDIFSKWIGQLKKSGNSSNVQKEINSVIAAVSQYNTSFGRAFLGFIRASISGDIELKDASSSWLTGEKNVPARLKETFNVIGKVDKLNTLDFLKAFTGLIEYMGYKGLIVLVDEVDLLIDERSDIRLNAYVNIKHVLDLLSSNEFGNTSFLFSGSSELFTNKEKGIYSYEALQQRMCGSLSNEIGKSNDFRNNLIHLKNLNLIDYQTLTSKVFKIYSSVYEIKLCITLESLKNWVFLLYKKENKNYNDVTVRNFLSRLIEILDIISQNPRNHVFNINLELQLNGSELVFKSKAQQKTAVC
ncbi:MAG: DUF2791 family P-loop domain-containing protein [Clostridiales bacterium]|nr:DUF2791 family P-loop domain-containing protein [Clostridiales bacterium]